MIADLSFCSVSRHHCGMSPLAFNNFQLDAAPRFRTRF